MIIKFREEFELETIRNERDFTENPELKNEPIIKYVKRLSYHTNTIRFDTYDNYRPFNSIYIPSSFLKGNEDVKLLQVVIRWNP